MICSSLWVTCNAVHHLKSFEPVLMPALDIIVRPAVAQTKQDHLILLANTEQLQLPLLLAKATMKSKSLSGCKTLLSFKDHCEICTFSNTDISRTVNTKTKP